MGHVVVWRPAENLMHIQNDKNYGYYDRENHLRTFQTVVAMVILHAEDIERFSPNVGGYLYIPYRLN